MSLVSLTQFNLVKSRRALERAVREEDWAAIRRLDDDVCRSLNLAFDDNQRNPAALVNEMEYVLYTYSRLVSQLSSYAQDQRLLHSPIGDNGESADSHTR